MASVLPRGWRSVLLAVLLCGRAWADPAVVLDSGSLTAGEGDVPVCRIVNLGPSAFDVTLDMLSDDGRSVLHDVRAVAPGRTVDQFDTVGNQTFRCRFSGEFPRAAIRAHAQVLRGGSTIAVVAAE